MNDYIMRLAREIQDFKEKSQDNAKEWRFHDGGLTVRQGYYVPVKVDKRSRSDWDDYRESDELLRSNEAYHINKYGY